MKDKERCSLMGLQVTVLRRFFRYGGNFHNGITKSTWSVVKCEPRVGWVVGFRNIYDGEIDHTEEGRIWTSTKAHPCMLVSYWPTMKPVHVPLDGWSFPLVDLDNPSYTEVPVAPSFEWLDWAKEEVSKQAKGQPRDAYGRFEAKIKREVR